MYTIIVVMHVLVSIALIGLVLIQHGKGADAGAAFGSGASGTVFGARGSANFLTRVTAWLAAAFFILSLALAYIVHGRSDDASSVVDAIPAEVPVPEIRLPTEGDPAFAPPAQEAAATSEGDAEENAAEPLENPPTATIPQ